MRLAYVGGLWVGEGWFGISVLRHQKKLQLQPQSSINMNDKESIDKADEILTEWEIPHYVIDLGKTKRIMIVGLKRMSRFLPTITPFLTGTKKRAAETVREWVEYRLSRPHGEPYTETDLEYVNRIRGINGNNGKAKDKVIPISILRDYT